MASSNIIFTRTASGDIPISHVTNHPSKQSTMSDKYTFPAGIANSVISVNHLIFGFPAKKLRFISLGTSGRIGVMFLKGFYKAPPGKLINGSVLEELLAYDSAVFEA